ncbi:MULTISPECIES: rhomboid family intramembrane serine protease [unclassified Gordonia (in: high G+C Gram-positive bacteria)]|uniref:rhomboid family intramembrane serine protease n=1 Tax=unclassified Gordonia (in: high G+C Gram-positive bacteria) TaxID=2657482 RepID=UPI001FFFFFF3|nr:MULTISPECIES: rhomboid family intramembrane serine protease [unclassified Gordonia (in: high G+C Gram-positive bacteria)]UQE75093.1 rhomboid family intramembrane serine protease [Gordonia sp. PP30]
MAQDRASVRVDPVAPVKDATATPYVTYGLIAVNTVVFLACIAQAGAGALSDRSEMWRSWLMREGVLITGYDGHWNDEYWRLLTSGFLHWSVIHIAVNMLSLYVVGRDLERFFGGARYLMLYVTSLLGGSAVVTAVQHSDSLTAGASGAIYGLLGALLVVVLRLKLPVGTVAGVIVLNVVISWSLPGISLWAHLGGLLFGALGAVAMIWLPVAVLPAGQRTEAKVSRVGWAALIALFVVAAAIGVGTGAVLSG